MSGGRLWPLFALLVTLWHPQLLSAQPANPKTGGHEEPKTGGHEEAKTGGHEEPKTSKVQAQLKPQAQAKPSDCASSPKMSALIARAEQQCVGHVIGGRELQGCIGTRCQSALEHDKLLSLMDLSPGSLLRAGMLARARCRVLQTELLRIPQVYCRLVAGEAQIALKVQGNHFVRSIVFRGNDKVFTDELQPKLSFQRGDMFNPETKEGKKRLKEQQLAFENVYHRQGFDDARVRIQTESLGVSWLRITVEISEGAKHRVSRYDYRIRGRQRPTEKDRAAGLICTPVTVKKLREIAKLGKIGVYTRRDGLHARRALRRWLRLAGYSNARVSLRHHRRSRRVAINIKLGRCSIVRILTRETDGGREGFQLTLDNQLYEALPFVESGVFDVQEAARGREALLSALENQGYLFAKVRMVLRRVPLSARSQVEAAVIYYVTTNYQAQIRGLRFIGARAFAPSDLAAEISTRSYDLFDEGGYLQTSGLFADLEHIKYFYRDHGYFEFSYPLCLKPGQQTSDGIRRRRYRRGGFDVFEFLSNSSGFRVKRPIGEHFIYVEIPLREGRRSKLTTLEISGPKQVSSAKVRQLLNLHAGAVLSFDTLLSGLRAVEAHYRELGFFNATLRMTCRKTQARSKKQAGSKEDAGAWGKCTANRILAEKIGVRLHVDEGQRMKMGEIFVSGNFETDTDVITRDLPLLGEDFSSQRLFEAQRRLRNLGLFRAVNFRIIGTDEQPPREKAALLIHVVELSSHYFNADAGFQTVSVENSPETPPGIVDLIEHTTAAQERLTTGYGQRIGVRLPTLLLTGELAYRNINFLGWGNELSVFARGGITPDPDTLFPPAVTEAAVDYNNRRLLGSDIHLKLIPGYFSRDMATLTIDVQKFGSATELSKRFGRLHLATGIDVGMVTFKDKPTADQASDFQDYEFQAKLIPRLSYDSLDSPLNPTRGFSGAASAAYINAMLIDSAGRSQGRHNFLKLEGTAKYYLTLSRSLVIATLIHTGWGLELSQEGPTTPLPATERFRLGGQLGLRGFSDGGVLRYDANGEPKGRPPIAGSEEAKRGLLYDCAVPLENGLCPQYATENDGNVVINGAIEARFPISQGLGLWGALFWDWGGWRTAGPSCIRRLSATGSGWGCGCSSQIRSPCALTGVLR